MPLYEYFCSGCGARFEVLQRIGANAADTVCPKCGGHDVAKQFSTFASAATGSGGSCGMSGSSSCGSGGFS